MCGEAAINYKTHFHPELFILSMLRHFISKKSFLVKLLLIKKQHLLSKNFRELLQMDGQNRSRRLTEELQILKKFSGKRITLFLNLVYLKH